MSILQRYLDWQHERYIRRLNARCARAMDVRDRVMARLYWRLLLRAIHARSPAKVAYMERRMELR